MSEEIDALIATKIMGWVVHPRNTSHWMRAEDDPVGYRPVGNTCFSDRFAPSRNIADAWRVVDRMSKIEQRNAIWWNCTAGSYICLDIDDGMPKTFGRIMFECPDKMPLAICLAALEAFRIELPNQERTGPAEPGPVTRTVGRFYGHCRKCRHYNTCNISELPEKGCCNYEEVK